MKNIIKMFVFGLIFIILLLLFNHIFSLDFLSVDDVITSKYAVLSEDENTVDVFFVGDSLVYSGISPLNIWNDYGYSTFNISVPDQRLNQIYEHLTLAFKNQKPKIVFFEASVFDYSLNTSTIIDMKLADNSNLMKHHDGWKNLFGESKKNNSSSGNKNTKGFRYSVEIKPFDKQFKKKKFEIEITEKYVFDKIIEMCEANDAKLIMINIPTIKNWNTNSHNDVVEFLKDYDLEYYDLNELDMIDWSKETRDGGEHLNYNGAKKVSNYLGEYIKNTGLVEDHRGDEKYASWQEAYDKSADKLF